MLLPVTSRLFLVAGVYTQFIRMYSSAWDLAGRHAPRAYFRPQNPRPQRHLQGPGADSGNPQLRDGPHIKKARPAYYIATRALKVARGAVHEYNRVAPSA